MDFLDGLLGALGELAAEIQAALIQLFNIIVQVFEVVWGAIQEVASFLVGILKDVGNFFVHLWSNFFKGIFLDIFNGIRKFVEFMQKVLRPVINFLKNVQKFIDNIYKRYIVPYLKLIQHIRQFLSILKLLHIKIAAQLDAVLAQAQHDIQQTFFTIRGILNTTIDLLNVLADPTKLLRKPTLILSMRRTINGLIRQVTGFPPAYFFPSPSPSAPRGVGFLPADFDPTNPLHNPPASYYLGLDEGVPDFSFLGDGEFPDDGSIDGMDPFGFFGQADWTTGDCVDTEICLEAAQVAALAGN